MAELFNSTNITHTNHNIRTIIGTETIFSLCSIISLIGILTVIGNAILIVAIILRFRKGYPKSNTMILVVSLSVADMLVGLVAIPFNLLEVMSNGYSIVDTVCLIGMSIDMMFCTSSIYHLVFMAADRYLAICKPFLHRRLSKGFIYAGLVVCWLVPIMLSFPPIMTKRHLLLEANVCDGAHDCPCYFPFRNTIYSISISLVGFVIPFILIVFFYLNIVRVIHNRESVFGKMRYSTNPENEKKATLEASVTKTIGIILACFCLAWTPFFSLYAAQNFIGWKVSELGLLISEWLAYCNSLLNPFVYHRCSEAINSAIKDLFSCKFRRYTSETTSGLPAA